MKYFIILMLGSLVLFSCGKKRMIKVSAVNPATGEGYAYLTYKVVQVKSGAFESNYKTVYEGELGADGKDAFDFRVKSGRYYIIATQNPNSNDVLPCYVNNSSYTFEKNSTEFDFQFEYAPCAYLETHVKNIDCQNSNDKIIFDLQPTYADNYSNITPQEEFGCYQNEFISSEVPYGPWEATWEVTKNGNTTNHDSLFYINEGESYVFLIEY
jgi:hypothetical protein